MPTDLPINHRAYRHGVDVADIRHALAHVYDTQPNAGALGLLMVVGFDRGGVLIEVGILHADTPQAVIWHAMRPARPQFY